MLGGFISQMRNSFLTARKSLVSSHSSGKTNRGITKMMRKVKGTTIIITGATSGIGRETALAFAAAGARVVIAGRRAERLESLVRELENKGCEALAVKTDVADQGQVENLVAKAIERFGKIDTLVNNAGVGIAASFTEQSLEDFQRVMEVNFWARFILVRLLCRICEKIKAG
jgi:NAD(P)-dependent dehydrogenase (short-subunit alcohol dehydrogenase family)